MRPIASVLIPFVTAAMLVGCSVQQHQGTAAEAMYYQSEILGFRVRVPQLAGAYSLADIVVDEKGAGDPMLGTTVTFTGPGDDPEVYRVRVFEKPENESTRRAFIGLAKQARENLVIQAEEAYDALLAKFQAQKIAVNGHDALVAVYRQAVQPRFTLHRSKQMRMRYHAMYFVDYGPKIAVFWIETPSDSWGTGQDLGERIATYRVPKINRFLSSFEWVAKPPQSAVLTGSGIPQPPGDAD